MSELIDNTRKKRVQKLKSIIKRLHEGEDFDTVKEAFEASFKDVSTEEISDMEAELVKDGMSIEEIQNLCDVHAKILGSSVRDIHKKDRDPGHPLSVLHAENDRLETLIVEEIEPYLSEEGNHPLLMLRIAFERLEEIKKHYTRKEQLLFPYLEKKGITAPPQVMWATDDKIRVAIANVRKRLDDVDITVANIREDIEACIESVRDMIFKENNILIPLLEEQLGIFDFVRIEKNSDDIGYFLQRPERSFKVEGAGEVTSQTPATEGTISLPSGTLTLEQLDAMLNTLPFDITFVDHEGRVKYFTQGQERIFDRPTTILDRHVNMCHPPASVHIVEKIVDRFKRGEKDQEDFWIQMRGMFVHIRYFAVRDKNGKYLGTLEVTQNIAPIQEIKGEKRLLDSDA